MTKKEIMEILKSFDDESILVFIDNSCDLLDLDNEGHAINLVVEINTGNTGTKKYIALVE